MYYTYVLLCTDLKRNKRVSCTGVSSDLPNREIDHKTKSVKTTKKFDKIELIYFEACLNKTDAFKREKQLKTSFGRGYLKRRLENYLKNARD